MLSEELAEAVRYGPGERKGPRYLAVKVLNPAVLTHWWERYVGPLYGDVRAHHMTLKYLPNARDLAQAQLGKTVQLRVRGVAQSAKVQMVTVDAGGLKVSSGKPHVTVALQGGAKAKEALKVFRGAKPVHNGPTIQGRVIVVHWDDSEHAKID